MSHKCQLVEKVFLLDVRVLVEVEDVPQPLEEGVFPEEGVGHHPVDAGALLVGEGVEGRLELRRSLRRGQLQSPGSSKDIVVHHAVAFVDRKAGLGQHVRLGKGQAFIRQETRQALVQPNLAKYGVGKATNL